MLIYEYLCHSPLSLSASLLSHPPPPPPVYLLFYLSVNQMVLDEQCVVRLDDTSKCTNQDILFLGTGQLIEERATIPIYPLPSLSSSLPSFFPPPPPPPPPSSLLSHPPSDNGKVFKVVFASGKFPVVSEELSFDDDNNIQKMVIHDDGEGSERFLFVNTHSKIYKLPLARCGRHQTCL